MGFDLRRATGLRKSPRLEDWTEVKIVTYAPKDQPVNGSYANGFISDRSAKECNILNWPGPFVFSSLRNLTNGHSHNRLKWHIAPSQEGEIGGKYDPVETSYKRRFGNSARYLV
jgi:hypothetical protein